MDAIEKRGLIIGLTGKKEVGKDTVGQYFVEHHNFLHRSYAAIMKQAVAALWGIPLDWVDEYKDPELKAYVTLHGGMADELSSTVKRSMDWREFLQRFGTEMGRETFGSEFWVDFVVPSLDNAPNWWPHSDIVITDVRFLNEAERIKDFEGKIIEIVRPGYEGDNHVSELGLPDSMIDVRIHNGGTIDNLLWTAGKVLNEFRRV